jgi:hypothetical protein
LTNVEKKMLVKCLDDEGAFMPSIGNFLSDATHLLCTGYLKNNNLKYMEDKGGYPVKACQNIVNLILNKE